MRQLRHRITHQLHRDRRAHAEQLARDMEAERRRGNAHGFWTILDRASTRPQPHQRRRRMPLQADAGQLAVPPAAQAAAFAQHFQQVLGGGLPVDPAVLASIDRAPNQQLERPPCLDEVVAAVRRLKTWRAADGQQLFGELLRTAGAASQHALHALVQLAWERGVPEVARQAVLVPLLKRGDPTLRDNYRGIQLVSMLRKVLALVISARLVPWAEEQLLECQAGFRPQRSCADQLFSLRHLSDLVGARQQRLYLCFVDLRKAFDSINRDSLWAILRHRGLPEQLITVLRDLHTGTSCRVRVGGELSAAFPTTCGTQQGDPLAGTLFAIYFDHAVRDALEAAQAEAATSGLELGVQLQYTLPAARLTRLDQPRDGPTGTVGVAQLLLADDMVVLATSAAALALFMRCLEAACKRWALVISGSKTECMVLDPRRLLPEERRRASTCCQRCCQPTPEDTMVLCDRCDQGWHIGCLQPPLAAVPGDAEDWLCPGCTAAAAVSGGDASREAPVRITVAGVPVRWVSQFKYLGSQLSSDGGLAAELAYRIQLAAAAFWRLQQAVWRHACVPLTTKVTIYKVLVSSVLLYGSHAWAPTPAQLQRLELVQRQHLRHILGRARWRVSPIAAALAGAARVAAAPVAAASTTGNGPRRSTRLAAPVPVPRPGNPTAQQPRLLSNAELYALCAVQPIEQQLRRVRGRWLGHVLRMGDERLAKQLLFKEQRQIWPAQRGCARPCGARCAALFPFGLIHHRYLPTPDPLGSPATLRAGLAGGGRRETCLV
jgi:hypothetical protein